ncbi:MAG: hypothetical protein IT385_20935 [Deltaproteobacteria bacterium]|nr:hypothetical protein [Deltaproteobacteria bacterium]
MPGFTLPLKILAKGWFVTKMKKLPIEWKQPSGKPASDQFNQAFDKPDHMAGGPPAPRQYFWNASTLKMNADTAKTISDEFQKFMDTAIDKTVQAIDMWRVQAKIKDLKVMAVCAIGTPGCLDGPKLKDTVPYSTWIGSKDNEKKWIKCIVDTMTDSWDKWQSKVMVPGLPWYPAFAAYPGPMAPPMPAIPMPLIVCPSPMMAELAVFMKLKQAFCGNHDGGLKDKDKDKQFEAFYESLAMALATNFLVWLPMQQLMTVMGKGPVPSFAPPYVPVGPVLNGDNLAIPGHCAA